MEQLVKFWELQAANQLLSDRESNEAFVASSEDGTKFVLFFPKRNDAEVKLALKQPFTQFELHWVDIDSGQKYSPELLKAKGSLTIRPPQAGNHAAVLLAKPN